MSAQPNFLIVGAPKCGTTALYAYLNKHREVFMPEVKEPYFFVKPKEVIGEGPADLSHRMFIDSEQEYAALFDGVGATHRAIGEASAGYLHFHQLVIPQVLEKLGDVRIIILIRDPVARAFSSHIHHVREQRETEDFRRAWELQERRAEKGYWFGFQLREVGCYASAIRAYQEAFSRVKVILNDDLNRETAATVRSCLEFLEVDPAIELAVSERHNENRLTRSETARTMIRAIRRRHLIPGSLARRAHRWNSYRPVLDREFAAEIAPEFADDLRDTSELIERDLGGWLDRYRKA